VYFRAGRNIRRYEIYSAHRAIDESLNRIARLLAINDAASGDGDETSEPVLSRSSHLFNLFAS